jgi:hypothetical protein
MATRRARRSEEDSEDPPENITAIATDVEQGDEDLAELGVQLPEGAMGTIWRMLEGGDKEFVDEQPIAGFSVAAIAARYGGGRYVMFLKKPHPEFAGRWFKAGSKKFRVIGAPRLNVGPSDAPAATALAGAAETEKLARSYGDLIQQSIRASIDSQQLMQQMQLALIKTMMDRPPAPPDNSFELLKVVLGKQAPTGPSIADVIALADRMASRTSPGSQMKETLELIKEVREIGGAGDDTGPKWMPIATKALGLLERAQQYQPKQLPPGAPAPAGDVAPAPVEVSPVSEDMHPLLKWLAPQIPSLVQHAQADHDPDSYAGMMVDLLPEEHHADVLTFLEQPTFPQQLQAAFPMTAAVAEWFNELRNVIIERLKEEDATPAATDTEATT